MADYLNLTVGDTFELDQYYDHYKIEQMVHFYNVVAKENDWKTMNMGY